MTRVIVVFSVGIFIIYFGLAVYGLAIADLRWGQMLLGAAIMMLPQVCIWSGVADRLAGRS
jgi:hypothetical protein